MDPIKISRKLSKILRHKPESFGLQLDKNGWLKVQALIEALEERDFPVTRKQIEEVVRTSDKQRFALSPDGQKIRANQGHSVAVDLGLSPQEPPDILYHGTVAKFLPAIQREGLQKMKRQHVHLSPDRETATKVGSRRGKAVILEIQAGRMLHSGYRFYLSENGVWLVDEVPVRYIHFPGSYSK